MVKIRFLQDRVVQNDRRGTAHETRFSAGQEVDVSEASAAHWINRRAAERVGEVAAEGSTAALDLLGDGAAPAADGAEGGRVGSEPSAPAPRKSRKAKA